MVSILAVVPRHERPRVRVRASRLRRADTGAPGTTRRLRWRACVQVAAIAPDLPFERLVLLTRCALWAYRLDDRAEALRDDATALARFRQDVAAVAAGPAAGWADPLLADFRDQLAELSGYDPTGEVAPRYGDAVRDAAAGEDDQRRLERAVASGAPPPTVDEYLAVAARNMNYRSFAYALLALVGEPLTGIQLDRIDEALWQASCAVRLANDVRGAGQDRARATLNVLDLRTGSGVAATPGYVWEEVDRRAIAHGAVLTDMTRTGTIPRAAARVLTRSLAQSIRLYRRTDLR